MIEKSPTRRKKAAKKVLPALPVERPPFRRLRAYAFDPSLSQELEHAGLNQVTLKVPWEFNPATGEDILEPGPVGEYVEVVDADPASDCFYYPVDLNQPYLLAQDGLAPAEGNPQFHQQVAYAVAMTTIQNFERALGRRALWSPRKLPTPSGSPAGNGTAPAGSAGDGKASENRAGKARDEELYEYVPRLRVYPHALREANAYYSPDKKALLFGYFPAPIKDVRQQLPGGIVFCCLSHDVVAHETTHALLDGMHRRYIEATNPDVLAFHEAFADIVALFQHFSFPEVLRHQVAKTRGNLATENLLAQLAQQFGQATGLHGALRDALGSTDPDTGAWQPKKADPADLQATMEPHARGSLLVAAVFRAFVEIYKVRSADLLRIATSGTGVLPEGELHPDLVNRLAGEAAKAAQHVVNMCIRALDYCPPVDLTFGDYLRALITADYDLVRDDDMGYRLAVVEAFRQYGIYPRDVRTLSIDSLRWQPPETAALGKPFILPAISDLRQLVAKQSHTADRKLLYEQQRESCRILHESLAAAALRWREKQAKAAGPAVGGPLAAGASPAGAVEPAAAAQPGPAGQNAAGQQAGAQQTGAQQMGAEKLADDERSPLAELGLDVERLVRPDGSVTFEVHSARPAHRVGPDGQTLVDMVIEITQWRPGYYDEHLQQDADARAARGEPVPAPDFKFRGGSTLLVDLQTGAVRYCVEKRVASEARLGRERAFRTGHTDTSLRAMYFGNLHSADKEPFAFLHRDEPKEPKHEQ